MTIEKLEKAQMLHKRIQRAEEILQMLKEVRNNDVQKEDIAEDDFITTEALHNAEEKVPKSFYYLTRAEIEVIKVAFENYKHQLNTEFSFL